MLASALFNRDTPGIGSADGVCRTRRARRRRRTMPGGAAGVWRLLAALSLALGSMGRGEDNLPVRRPVGTPLPGFGVRNALTWSQMHNVVDGDERGLVVKLGDSGLAGYVAAGPYPFDAGESDYDYARYRYEEPIRRGEGVVRLDAFFLSESDANNWSAALTVTGRLAVAYRLDLVQCNGGGGGPRLGVYDGVRYFRRDPDGRFIATLSVTEGPFVSADSTDPSAVRFFWRTDRDSTGAVHVAQVMGVSTNAAGAVRCGGALLEVGPRRVVRERKGSAVHELTVRGLLPAADYVYYVSGDEKGEFVRTYDHRFRTAPAAGSAGRVSFAFVGDSREGVGSDEARFMGVNLQVLSAITVNAYRRGADFLLFGGNLVTGYTAGREDFALQLRAWKRVVSGFWRTRPVWTAMGSRETLLDVFKTPGGLVRMDKSPYESDSAEAVFAEEFMNPLNGPSPSDPRRPPYLENVYAVQYGPVVAIAFNNAYWFTSEDRVPGYGGSPDGYLMDDQLEWIESSLAAAVSNSTVRYVVLFGSAPVFPCGGALRAGMWYGGNNTVAAGTWDDGAGRVILHEGILAQRNRFWKAVAGCPKVAAVLVGDEHEYHRLLIDDQTPVGMPGFDPVDETGRLTAFSANPDFTYPTWQLTAGTAGAPYQNTAVAPWSPVVSSQQCGYLLFAADEERISMRFITLNGQVLDEVADLMAVKRPPPPPSVEPESSLLLEVPE